MRRVQLRLGRVLFAVTLFGGAACYDSRWGEAKRAQQRAWNAGLAIHAFAIFQGRRLASEIDAEVQRSWRVERPEGPATETRSEGAGCVTNPGDSALRLPS